MKWYYLLILLIVCCGKEQVGPSAESVPMVRDVDAAFEQYVTAFENFSKKQVNFYIGFDDLANAKAGICFYWQSGARRVLIDTYKWTILTDLQRRQLVYHELGHCLLGRGHDNTNIDAGNFGQMPKSIMRDFMFNLEESNYFSINMEYYVNELLGKGE